MQPLAQPPRKEDGRFDDWMFRLWKRIADTAGLAWSLVDKTGSNLTDIETRNHADLQNINTANYTHLSATNHTDLTDGGATTLHKHDHGGMDGLADDDHAQYVLVSNMESDRATIITKWDDLTDGGESTLHYHNADRKTQNTISSAFSVGTDESYVVISYLNVQGDITIAGNVRII